MVMAEALGQQIGIVTACQVLHVPRSSLYRARQPQAEPQPRAKSGRALSEAEETV
jgi:hypothetical protein